MSRHEGVSCDACMKANFRGRRYKCLTCYDYDLCSTCYENNAVTNQHLSDHPMQCILTKNDFELFHGGETGLTSSHPQSLTCPFCGKMGFTEATLKDHVTALHPETSSFEVVCPICASVFGGDPNHITDDFGGHLALDHLSGAPRDLDVAENTARHNVRRISQQARGFGRGVARQNMRFGDSMDPIAELLSQLSGVRRAPGSDLSPSLHYDQATLRQHIRRGTPARVHGTGLNSNTATSINNSANPTTTSSGTPAAAKPPTSTTALPPVVASLASQTTTSQPAKTNDQQSNFLLSRLGDLEKEQESKGKQDVRERANFVQELVLSTLSTALQIPQAPQISVTHPSPPPDTLDASTQTSSSPSAIVNAVHSPSLTFNKTQPSSKQPAPKSQKYSYLTNPAQQPLRGLPHNIGINASQGNGRPPPPEVSSMSKKKPTRGNDGRATSQPPH